MTRMTFGAVSTALAMMLTAGFAVSQEQTSDERTTEVTAEEIGLVGRIAYGVADCRDQ